VTTVTVSLNDIESASRNALVKHGAADWIAVEMAKAIVKAEATGNLICGLYYLESYCQQLQTGRVDGTVQPEVQTPKSACVQVNARFGFAQPAFAKGLPIAVKTAQQAGTCAFSVCHAHTCTSLGFFTEQIANAGLVGIGFTNASAVVSPPGGTKAVLGTNPIAMSVPAREGGVMFQFDQSTSAVALGKITMAKAAGQSIPLGWAVDADGQPTTDPAAALQGSLVSTGGSVNSLDVAGLKLPDGAPHDLGQFYFLLDPTAASGDAFWDRLARLSDAVDAQPEARLPGTRGAATDTVTIEQAVWTLTQSLAN